MKRRFFTRCLAVLAAAWLFNACQDGPDREPQAPAAVPLSDEQLAALQDSLATYLAPGTFQAVLRGSPFNDETADAPADQRMAGPATFSSPPSDSGAGHPYRFVLTDSTSTNRIEIAWRPAQGGDTLATLRPGTFEQQLNQEPPTLEATVQQGQQRLRSRNGTLTVDSMGEEGMQGRFFFELRRPEETGAAREENWFSLVGAFDARHETTLQ